MTRLSLLLSAVTVLGALLVLPADVRLVASRADARVPPASQQDAADAAYADRESAGRAREAVAIWNARLTQAPDDIESAWKLARAHYWLGTNGPDSADVKKRILEEGVAIARRVIALAPARPEGHFWLAANMGALAESHGLRQGLRYRGAIRDALETVLKIDPSFLQGSADRALGRWYYKVPRLFGGNMRRSEEHLRRALAYNDQSVITHLFLAETLDALGRRDHARRELEIAIAAPVDAQWAPEDRRFKAQAAERLAALAR